MVATEGRRAYPWRMASIATLSQEGVQPTRVDVRNSIPRFLPTPHAGPIKTLPPPWKLTFYRIQFLRIRFTPPSSVARLALRPIDFSYGDPGANVPVLVVLLFYYRHTANGGRLFGWRYECENTKKTELNRIMVTFNFYRDEIDSLAGWDPLPRWTWMQFPSVWRGLSLGFKRKMGES